MQNEMHRDGLTRITRIQNCGVLYGFSPSEPHRCSGLFWLDGVSRTLQLAMSALADLKCVHQGQNRPRPIAR